MGGQLSGGDPVRSVVSKLARLERLNRLSMAPQRLRVQFGYLKKLPDDYTGARHTINCETATVRAKRRRLVRVGGAPWT